MVIIKPTFGKKEFQALLITIGAFIVFAASAVGYALTRNTVFIIPMIIFGLICLIVFLVYLMFAIKSAKQENVKPQSKTVKKEEEKATDKK